MATVGIIANPMAGRDIRRLVARGRFVPNHEKVNLLARVLTGLEAVGVDQVVMMPDSAGLGRGAVDVKSSSLKVRFLEMPVFNDDHDSTRATRAMASMNVGCLVTLGGDGTNRAVAKESGQVPIVPVSTGTNNAFPAATEGTVAGLAAGVVATGIVDLASVAAQVKLMEIRADGSEPDIALVDVAVSSERFIGARAIWDATTLQEIYLVGTRQDNIGLSAIGARLQPTGDGQTGLRIRIGEGGTKVLAAIAPGIVSEVPVSQWSPIKVDEVIPIGFQPCTVALDGERTFTLSEDELASVAIRENGPLVVDVASAMREATLAGAFGGSTAFSR